jgi:hypothetical protein
MLMGKKLRLLLACGALSSAAMACAPPEMVPAHATKARPAYVFSAKSTATSRTNLGVARWHSTVEPGTNAALTIDGQDKAGRVMFLSTAFVDKKTSTIHIQVVLPQRGELVWDIKHQKVLTNTIPASAVPFAKGIYFDYPRAHAGAQAYSYWGGVWQVAAGSVLGIVGGVLIATGGGAGLGVPLTAGGIGFVVNGVKDIIDSQSAPPGAAPAAPAASAAPAAPGTPAASDPSASTPSDPSATPSDPSATPSDPSATPSDPSATPSDPSATPSDPSATPSDPSATPSDPSAGADATPTELPADNAGNLDNVGSDPSASDPGASDPGSSDPGASDPGASDPGGGDTSGGDTGGDTSGGDTGGDTGGDSFASGRCRKAATSKTSGVRACVHY